MIQTKNSACPLDCPDACSLEVDVDEGGRVVRIDGRRGVNPLTEGFICGKVRGFAEHVHGEDRVLHPAVRRGRKGEGKFERVGWDDALEQVARRLAEAKRRHGGESILPISYGGSNGFLSQDTLDARLFRRLGSSRCLRTLCAAPSGAAAMQMYGKMPGVALQDYERAKLIVLWGMNPQASGIHLVPVIQRAIGAGARLVVIDPRATPLARRADLHLAIRPGTDLPVALAVARGLFESNAADREFLAAHATGAEELERRAAEWTFERAAAAAGVPATDLERFARLYAETSPAVIRAGWGAERNRNGGSAIAAILALPALAGKFGVRGGGYTMSNSGAWKLDATAASREPEPATRAVNMNRLGEALLTLGSPRVEALFVYNCNPLATLPAQEKVRRGLEREDLFTVVFDQVRTDTALYADVLLPATTFLEHEELSRGYGALVLQRAKAAIPPVGESRSNVAVFGELCRRLSLTRPGEPETEAEIASALLRSGGPRRDLEAELDRNGIAFPDEGAAPIQFVDSFPRTPDRKIALVPEALDRESPVGLYRYQEDPGCVRYPLALVSPSSEKTISSTLGQLSRKRAEIEMHPSDAAARGLANGDRVVVHNEMGEVRCALRVTDSVRPGVVSLAKGLWARHTENGSTANALCPDTLTDLGGGACFNDARVDVRASRPGQSVQPAR